MKKVILIALAAVLAIVACAALVFGLSISLNYAIFDSVLKAMIAFAFTAIMVNAGCFGALMTLNEYDRRFGVMAADNSF